MSTHSVLCSPASGVQGNTLSQLSMLTGDGKGMKAAQLVGPKLFEFIDIEMPTIKDGECLIKLERVSICGSDIRHGYGPRYAPDHYPLQVGRPCHECAGGLPLASGGSVFAVGRGAGLPSRLSVSLRAA